MPKKKQVVQEQLEDPPHVRRKNAIYLAKLAEQAERYSDMAEHMHTAALIENELGTQEERQLLAVGFKQAVGARRKSWREVAYEEEVQMKKGNEDLAGCARTFRKEIEGELHTMCNKILELLRSKLIPHAKSAEAKVQYHKAEGDYYRYIAEITDNKEKTEATAFALEAYQKGTAHAEVSLPVTDTSRLGLALNFAVFNYETMKRTDDAVSVARKAFEDAVRELDNMEDSEDTKKAVAGESAALIMQLLRDNLTLWTADDA